MTEQEKDLRERVEQGQQQLNVLGRALQSIDDELEALSAQRDQFEVLDQVCDSLLELDEFGLAHLFWGEQDHFADTAEHVYQVRQRIEKFNGQVANTESRRQSTAAEIAAQHESMDTLDDDLLDHLQEEESRKSEWLIEAESRGIAYHKQVMPWERGTEEDRRFHKSLGNSVLACILLVLLATWVKLPVPDLAELTQVPERVAQMIRQEREVPPPQPVIAETAPDEPEEVEPEEELLAEQEPELVPEPSEEVIPEEVKRQAAREAVASKGILAFRDSFASRAQSRSNTQLGSNARIGNTGDAAVGRPERAMVTTQAPGSSGGINLASLSRDVGGGGGQIEGVELTRVASSIGVSGGGSDRPLSGGAAAGRTDEEIQIVFDRYKAALYRLYNRELRKNPTLRGKMVLRLTIEPDGTVSLCELQSSDMKAPALAQQVVARVRTFDFGAKEDIVAVTIVYPIDFLPAA